MDWRPGYPVDCRGDLIAFRARSGPYGDVEFAAARIVARSTGARVTLADDSSRPRTPDLLIEYADGRIGVGEIVTVIDQHRAAEASDWVNGGLDLHGDKLAWEWWVTAPANVNRHRLRAPLLRILEEMEAADERPPMLVPIDANTAGPGGLKLLALGMTEATGNDQPGERRGVVDWQPEGIGGEPAPDVDGCQTWLDDFLNGALAQDKILKIIAEPGDHEGHLLVGARRLIS